MKFPVLTEDELNRPAYEPGIYWFTVKKVEETESKAGNPMFKIEILVDFERGHLAMADYLLCTREASWKISQFCKAIGKEDLYKSGNIDPLDILNKQGKCEVHFELNKENGKKYLRVKSYIIPEKTDTEVEVTLNDDIPF